MNSLSDLNILFCYDEQKIGAVKRANQFSKQLTDIEVHTVPKHKVIDVDDEFTHVVIDKTAVDITLNSKAENKLYMTNCHREQYSWFSYNQIIVPDYSMPYTICRYNLQYPYENQYQYLKPLVNPITPNDERTERLLVIGRYSYMVELAKWIVQNASDVNWTITSYDSNICKMLDELNSYNHQVVCTSAIEPLLEKAKYVVHYGSHQLTMECIESDLVQLIIPPPNNRYYLQHAFRVKEFKIGSIAFDLFHKIPIERRYQILRSIRCNYRSYKQNLEKYREQVEQVKNKCTPHTIFTQNLKT